jgi:hypothetical protein
MTDAAERILRVRADIAAASDLLAEQIASADHNGRQPDTTKEH